MRQGKLGLIIYFSSSLYSLLFLLIYLPARINPRVMRSRNTAACLLSGFFSTIWPPVRVSLLSFRRAQGIA